MKQFYYGPTDGYLADVIPFYWEGKFRLFYLHDYRDMDGHGEGTPWRQLVSEDLVHFQEQGEMISRGCAQDQDLYIFTGCVIHAQEQFHIFYTGHNPHFEKEGKCVQGVMHAVSDNLIRWRKIPEHTFYAPHGYELHDWRDPFVFYDEQDKQYHMLLAARKLEGPARRRGMTAHLISKDLVSWQTIAPLWEPRLYYTHECPDLFRIGEWYYLIYSEFTNRCMTRYVRSRSLYGPWEAPKEDVFDSRAFYAAKTAFDGENRYLFGWNPTRKEEKDSQLFVWGGNLVVHELWQNEEGELRVKMPANYLKHFSKALPVSWKPLSGNIQALKDGSVFALENSEGYAALTSETAMPSCFLLSMNLKATADTQTMGLQLRHDRDIDFSYGLVMDIYHRQWRFEHMPNEPWSHMETEGLWRYFQYESGEAISIQLLVDGDMFTLYVNEGLALSGRMCKDTANNLSLFATHGRVEITNVSCYVP